GRGCPRARHVDGDRDRDRAHGCELRRTPPQRDSRQAAARGARPRPLGLLPPPGRHRRQGHGRRLARGGAGPHRSPALASPGIAAAALGTTRMTSELDPKTVLERADAWASALAERGLAPPAAIAAVQQTLAQSRDERLDTAADPFLVLMLCGPTAVGKSSL